MDIDHELNIDELRGRVLAHSRRAYQLLPPFQQPRILDIGCGRGQLTMELARLSGGLVVGIDIDRDALSQLQLRIDEAGLGDRIKAVEASLFDNGFDNTSFDILWEEGVFHLLDAAKTLSECHRLLKPGGYVVMHETISWFESIRDNLSGSGFELMNQHMLPKCFWWTDYGAPLEERIRVYRETHGDSSAPPELAEHERIVAAMKSDPDKTDCGIYLVQLRQ